MVALSGIVPVIGIPIALLIGAAILRAAVAWHNKMTGAAHTPPQTEQPSGASYSPNVSGGKESANPFAAPTAYGPVPGLPTGGIPKPGFGRACGIVGLSWLVSLPVWLMARWVVSTAPNTEALVAVVCIPVTFLTSALVLKGMLPTARFSTAVAIEFLQLAIGLIGGLVAAAVAIALVFTCTIIFVR